MKFPELWVAGAPWHRSYGFGFWNGDLLCTKHIPQKLNQTHREWERERENHLSPISSHVGIAFLKFLLKDIKRQSFLFYTIETPLFLNYSLPFVFNIARKARPPTNTSIPPNSVAKTSVLPSPGINTGAITMNSAIATTIHIKIDFFFMFSPL